MSGPINDGGPAYPIAEYDHQTFLPETLDEMRRLLSGMSLRDHFAGLAMQGMVTGHFSHYGHENFWKREDLAAEAYEIADAMLQARSA